MVPFIVGGTQIMGNNTSPIQIANIKCFVYRGIRLYLPFENIKFC